MALHPSMDWSRRLRQVISLDSSIPTDITFEIVDAHGVEEVKAHKMILGMASPIFLNMFFLVDTTDRLATKILIKGTSAPAFQTMLDAIYHVKSIKHSLKGKTVDEAFEVLDLVTRYQIPELVNDVKKHLASLPLSEQNVIDIVADARVHLLTFQETARSLILKCLKFMKTIDNVLTVLDLVTNYQIPGLIPDILERLVSMPLSDDNVMQVASKAVELEPSFKEEAQDLLYNCAKFLNPKFTSAKSVFQFAAENVDQMVAVCKLQAIMNDLSEVCPNCQEKNCQNGIEVKPNKYRMGLSVTKMTDFKAVGYITKLTFLGSDVVYVYVKINDQIQTLFQCLGGKLKYPLVFRCVR